MKFAYTENLKPGMVLVADVYSADKELLIGRGTVLNTEDIALLIKKSVTHVHISNRRPTLRHPIRIAPRFELPKRRAIIDPDLRASAIGSIESAFDLLSLDHTQIHEASAQVLNQIDTVVKQLVDTLADDQGVLVNINDLKSYDEYTFHHSLSVAVLAIAIGQRLNYTRLRLNELGRSAILHDMGKTAVPIEIIRKSSRLDDHEFDIIRSHPFAGYNYLLECGITNAEVLTGVLMHHEKLDGTGYPYGIKGERIPPFARIISVADVYDALTSVRPYRKPNEPAEAVEYIMGGVDASFDYDIVQAFVKKLDLYPIGSFVRLSTKQNAVVIDNENQLRPVVCALDTGEYMDLFLNRKFINVTIEALLPDGAIIIE